MNETVTSHTSWGGKEGLEISQRADGAFVLRTWHNDGHRIRAARPIHLTMRELEQVFDDIGQHLVDENMARLTEIMEAM